MAPLILILALALQLPATPARDSASSPDMAGPGVLKGQVIDGSSGRPIKGVAVSLYSPGRAGQPQPTTVTDQDGRWEFRGLELGEYVIFASKAGFIQPGGERNVPLTSVRPERSVDLALARGGVVTGRVTDAEGEPMSGAVVMALRQLPTGRGSRWNSFATATTDDRGEFRLFGLSPGDYVLGAEAQEQQQTHPRRRVAPVRTYFPGTPDIQAAQRFTIEAASEYSDVAIPIQVLPSITIRGVVSPKPASQGSSFAQLNPAGSNELGLSSRGTPLNPDGTFEFGGVPPGGYKLGVRVDLPSGESRVGELDVTAADSDLVGLIVATRGPATVRGRITFAPAGTAAPGPIGVNAQPIGDVSTMFGAEGATAQPDGTFELKLFSAPVKLYANPNAEGWYQSATRWKGHDVSGGLMFEPGQLVDGVELTLRLVTSRVVGTVRGTTRGKDDHEGMVIVFRAGDTDDRDATDFGVATMSTIRDGRFGVGPIPAGEYQLVAIPKFDREWFGRPEIIELIRARGVAISIGDRETKSVQLDLVTEY